MYGNCIFCSASLGRNEAIESFPVGRQVAFDSWKGRLWAVCPACGRWNLAPIEERWEPVEAAEKLFRDARLRVQSENVGLAQLPDGTRIVRVGAAVPGELAAWRYGTQLLQRRRRHLIVGGASGAAVLAAYGGMAAMGVGTGAMWMGWLWLQSRLNQRVVHRIGPQQPGTKGGVIVRRWHLEGISLRSTADGRDVEVHVRDAHRNKPSSWRDGVNVKSRDVITVGGDEGRALLSRAMVHVNRKGATPTSLEAANRILHDAGSADRILLDAAAGGAALGKKAGSDPSVLKGPGALAFEMALNEAAERVALEGELSALAAAWREAEEIAAIADALPGEATLNRLLDRLAR